MPSRSVRRRKNKRLARVGQLTPEGRTFAAMQSLLGWKVEARKRAQTLSAPEVWALAADPRNRELANRLDESGDLLADLQRICAEAVAEMAESRLLTASRPAADRVRLRRSPTRPD